MLYPLCILYTIIVWCLVFVTELFFSHLLQTMRELMRLDEQELNNRIKVGVLYCKAGQTNEEEWYNNGERMDPSHFLLVSDL